MRRLLTTAAMLTVFTSPAFAWDTPTPTASVGPVNAGAAAHATAVANTSVAITNGAAARGGNAVSSSGGGNQINAGNNTGGVGFALPSLAGAGQCTPVGIGPGGFGQGGGGGGLLTWESTNCRNYYIALALISTGRVEEGVHLLEQITPEAQEASRWATQKPVTPVNASPEPSCVLPSGRVLPGTRC